MAERKQKPGFAGLLFAVTARKTARPDSICLQRERCERRKAASSFDRNRHLRLSPFRNCGLADIYCGALSSFMYALKVGGKFAPVLVKNTDLKGR